jgi:hypothetical protein
MDFYRDRNRIALFPCLFDFDSDPDFDLDCADFLSRFSKVDYYMRLPLCLTTGGLTGCRHLLQYKNRLSTDKFSRRAVQMPLFSLRPPVNIPLPILGSATS